MKIGKINCISIAETAYALALKDLASPPLKLYSIGILPTKRRPTVAIVGSRKPTAYGRAITEEFATALAKRGVVIISGLAFGIDAIAHQAALSAGGTTIAVMPGGLHKVYPVSHTNLAKGIVKSGGALVTEQPLGYEVRKHDFLARNRIISGLADAILVPEATVRSGTLSTVNHALEQGREVFAIPGPITSPLSAGTNSLIQQGAQVALTPNDILEVIAPELLQQGQQAALLLGDTAEEVRLLELIQAGIQERDQLITKSQLTPSVFLQTITLLELKGMVRAIGGGRWALKL